MPSRMSLTEKIQHYVGRVHVFEMKNNFAVGKYTFSEYVFMLILGLLFAYYLPQLISTQGIWSAITILLALYILYFLACFLLAGGRGRIVDVMN